MVRKKNNQRKKLKDTQVQTECNQLVPLKTSLQSGPLQQTQPVLVEFSLAQLTQQIAELVKYEVQRALPQNQLAQHDNIFTQKSDNPLQRTPKRGSQLVNELVANISVQQHGHRDVLLQQVQKNYDQWALEYDSLKHQAHEMWELLGNWDKRLPWWHRGYHRTLLAADGDIENLFRFDYSEFNTDRSRGIKRGFPTKANFQYCFLLSPFHRVSKGGHSFGAQFRNIEGKVPKESSDITDAHKGFSILVGLPYKNDQKRNSLVDKYIEGVLYNVRDNKYDFDKLMRWNRSQERINILTGCIGESPGSFCEPSTHPEVDHWCSIYLENILGVGSEEFFKNVNWRNEKSLMNLPESEIQSQLKKWGWSSDSQGIAKELLDDSLEQCLKDSQRLLNHLKYRAVDIVLYPGGNHKPRNYSFPLSILDFYPLPNLCEYLFCMINKHDPKEVLEELSRIEQQFIPRDSSECVHEVKFQYLYQFNQANQHRLLGSRQELSLEGRKDADQKVLSSAQQGLTPYIDPDKSY